MGMNNMVEWTVKGLVAVLIVGSCTPVFAHKIEVSGDVGGTVHIEPNDNPRAGTPSLAWFALTRQGGELIPLEDCTCQLSVYAQPRQAADTPLEQPSLEPVSVEGYRNIPGADITFPQVGAYELVLQGEPKTPNAFQPFELTFAVTVAVGQTASTPAPSSIAEPSSTEPGTIAAAPSTHTPSSNFNWLFWAVPLGVVAIVLPLLLRSSKK